MIRKSPPQPEALVFTAMCVCGHRRVLHGVNGQQWCIGWSEGAGWCQCSGFSYDATLIESDVPAGPADRSPFVA